MNTTEVGIKTGYALRYPMTNPHRGHSDVWYQKTKAGRLIGLDRASGGYPYPVRNFRDVKLWDRMDDAIEYQLFFPENKFDLVQVTIEVKTSW